MKILLIAVCFLLFNNTSNAQTVGVQDTLAYLQQIEANKSHYIGQPFSVLENALNVDIKYFFPFADIHSNKFAETSTRFAFYYPASADDTYLTYPSLDIYWISPYLNLQESFQLMPIGNFGKYLQIVSSHYANRIIRNIIVRQ